MEVKHIVYYRGNDEKRDTLSLRDFCLREGFELKDIFYAVRDAVDSQELLDVLQRMCYEHIELECDEPSHIRFTVVDAYDNTNYLKLKKTKNRIHTAQNVVGIGA
jgi:hypothetical protein